MKYKYKVHRNKLSNQDINELSELYKDNPLLFDPNNHDHIYDEPEVWMKCIRCHQEFEISLDIIITHNHGNHGIHSLRCPVCNVKNGVLYPRDLIDLNGFPITIDLLLKHYK